MWRKRREQGERSEQGEWGGTHLRDRPAEQGIAASRGGRLRGLFAWRMDRRAPAQVPLAASPDDALREGRPAMPTVFCARCSQPNAESARFCSNCGAPLVRGGVARGGTAPQAWTERPGETTSTLSLNRDDELAEEPYPDHAALASLPPGSALLIVLRGPNAGSRFLLDNDLISAGRHPDSDIFLDDVTVSRRHAEFYRHGDRFTVRDVGSHNGTYVNRERIEETELFGGDELQVGKFRLLFLAPSAELGRRHGPGAQDYA